jgi:GxxExxY protein
MSTESMQQEGYDFMATAFEVHEDMGNGYTEDIDQESLEMELADRQMPFRAQAELVICYKRRPPKKSSGQTFWFSVN